jgi:hypothetical protein
MTMALEIGLDYQVEVWKRFSVYTGWVKVYEGFHRTWVWQSDNNGSEMFTSYGAGYASLLARRIVAAYAGTVESSKSGKAETVIKEYVNENAGPGASTDRVMPGLYVEMDGQTGNDWQGGRSWNNLLEVCQDIANSGGGDFEVVGIGPSMYVFRWHTGQLGYDRTLGNLYGNDPVIFSLQRNNMLTPVLSINNGQEYNCVYVLGQGEGTDRQVMIMHDASAVSSSPWNRVEVSRQATNEETEEALQTVGAEELTNGGAKTSVTFEASQTPASAFGIHYGLGDLVTAIYHQRVDKKIVKVSVAVGDNDESIRLEMSDVR